MIETDGAANRSRAGRGEQEKNAAEGAPGTHPPLTAVLRRAETKERPARKSLLILWERRRVTAEWIEAEALTAGYLYSVINGLAPRAGLDLRPIG